MEKTPLALLAGSFFLEKINNENLNPFKPK
jgi:hypothetical protein